MSFFLINDIRLNLPMGWVPFQLLYLGPFSNVRCRIVSLRYIYELDHSVGLLKDMPCGSYAERESPAEEWKIKG